MNIGDTVQHIATKKKGTVVNYDPFKKAFKYQVKWNPEYTDWHLQSSLEVVKVLSLEEL